MTTPRTPFRSRRPAHLAAASFVLAAGIAVASAQPASAQVVMVVVPPGCGSASGTLVPASQLDDHSNDAGPIGTQLNPYLATVVPRST